MSQDQTVSGSYCLPNIAHARVEDAMRPGVITCAAEMPLRAVAGVMATKHIHSVLVAGTDRRGDPPTWRILSGLDIVAATLADPDGRTAGDLATAEPITVSSHAHLERAATLMVDHQVDHLLVLGAQDGRPVGMLSSLDIAGAIAWGEV